MGAKVTALQPKAQSVPATDRRCKSCGAPQHRLDVHYGAERWHICEVCGMAEQDFGPDADGNSLANAPGFIKKRYAPYRYQQFAATYTRVLDAKTAEPAAGEAPILVKSEFWLRADAFDRLAEALSALAVDTGIAFLVPLAPGRSVRMTEVSSLIGDGSYAYRFGWQTFFMLLLRLGLKDIWRHDAEGGLGGLYLVSARVGRSTSRPKLSVIMPVFNEKKTIAESFARVDRKLLGMGDIDSEIILVESNSGDGTKDIVRSFPESERLKIVWQERPRGKGHAVREGLDHAAGDIVLIQDADNEYSVDDYDHLIDALLSSRAPFVLGARDTSGWTMRAFHGASFLSFVYNFGHVFFTTFVNGILRTRLHDPFTMYKVFFRECLHGIHFRCNRFDFDHEMIIKLVRKGFVPIELPASYTARSHADGKKVSVVKDGLFWITTDLRLRFEPLGTAEYH